MGVWATDMNAASNCDGAREVGITAHQLVVIEGEFQTDALLASIEELAAR